jgi:hypothetical protein
VTGSQFVILGLPKEEKHPDAGNPIVERVHSCLVGVDPCGLPARFILPPTPPFLGKLKAHEPNSMVGMSGGPIFKLNAQKGKFRYWLHGVQARWLTDSRVAVGWPMEMVAQFVRDWQKAEPPNP